MDDDDKVRRNFVAASSVVIALQWFGIHLPALVSRMLSPQAATPPQAAPPLTLPSDRLWAAVLVVLLYLAWRFWHSEDVATGRKAFREKRTLGDEKLVKQILEAAVERFARTGKESSLFVRPILEARNAEYLRELSEELKLPQDAVDTSLEVGRYEYLDRWQGSVILNMAITANSGASTRTARRGNKLQFQFKVLQRWRVTAQSWLAAFFFGDTAVKLGVPAVLGLVAITLAALKLLGVLPP
jgi:hypothetical protein